MNSNSPQSSQRKRGPRWRAFALCASIVALSLGGGVATANASTIPGDPGGGAVYGISTDPTSGSLGTGNETYTADIGASACNTGGWALGGTQFQAWDSLTSGDGTQLSGSVDMCEPLFVNDYGTQGIYVGGDIHQPGTTNAAAASVGADFGEPYHGSGDHYICANTQWSQPSDDFDVESAYNDGQGESFAPNPGTGSDTEAYAADLAIIGPSSCPYLVSVTIEVSPWQGFGVQHHYYPTWTAEQAADPPGTYGNLNDDQEACNVTGASSTAQVGCSSYIIPDPTTVAACGTPPNWQPFDVTTYDQFVPWLVFWPGCWFIPKGGFDRNGVLASAWNAGAAGQLQVDANEFGDAFAVTPSCGDIGGSTTIDTATLAIDTCTWSTWAPAAQTFLDLVLVIGTGVWAIRFLWSTIGSLIGMKSPVGGEAGE